jgi:nicotinate phosphoribosyltransferase
MPAPVPPTQPPSILSLDLDAFVAVRAALHSGHADARATFECSFEHPAPHTAFMVFAGLEPLLDALERFRPKPDEVDWLDELGAIDADIRHLLATMRFACDVDAAPEGTVVFGGEPVLVVEGPYWQAQLIGGLVTRALTQATLVATQMARCSLAAGGREIVEAGASSAYGLLGGTLLARAAYIGGASATTCTQAGRRYAIPLRAPQPARALASAKTETAAFESWLRAAPAHATLRIDAHEPKKMLEQAARAIKKRAGVDWSDAGYAIEIAFGDHVEVAREALRVFKAAGLKEPLLIASGSLDEWRISEIRRDEPRFAAFSVDSLLPLGMTRIARYDLVAMEDDGRWHPRFRLGESLLASHNPGRKKVLRYIDSEGHPVADIIHASNERIQPTKDARFLHRATGMSTRVAAASSQPLQSNVMRDGKRVSAHEPTREGRARAQAQVASLRDPHKRLTRPSPFPIGVSPVIAALKDELAGTSRS